MKNCTDLTVILDRSSSMRSVQSEMEEVLNGFITTQQREPGECTFTLVKFDDQYEVPLNGVPLGMVGQVKLEPRGSTALLDAIGRTIDNTGNRLARLSENERPNKVLFVIITDGEENSSSEYAETDPRKGPKAKKINDMVKHQREKYSWTFLFLGADQDSITNSSGMGFDGTMSTNYSNTSRGIKGMGTRLNKMSSAYRASENTAAGIMNIAGIAAASANTVTEQDAEEWDDNMKKLDPNQQAPVQP